MSGGEVDSAWSVRRRARAAAAAYVSRFSGQNPQAERGVEAKQSGRPIGHWVQRGASQAAERQTFFEKPIGQTESQHRANSEMPAAYNLPDEQGSGAVDVAEERQCPGLADRDRSDAKLCNERREDGQRKDRGPAPYSRLDPLDSGGLDSC